MIDCLNRKVVDAQPGQPFFALSYVWGELSPEADMSYDTLEFNQVMPQTISQSIQLTLGLGSRYLWIDRYVSEVAMMIACTDESSAYPSMIQLGSSNRYCKWEPYTRLRIWLS